MAVPEGGQFKLATCTQIFAYIRNGKQRLVDGSVSVLARLLTMILCAHPDQLLQMRRQWREVSQSPSGFATAMADLVSCCTTRHREGTHLIFSSQAA